MLERRQDARDKTKRYSKALGIILKTIINLNIFKEWREISVLGRSLTVTVFRVSASRVGLKLTF